MTLVLSVVRILCRYFLVKMTSVYKPYIFLIFFGIEHTKACSNSTISSPGDKVNVSIPVFPRKRSKELEVYFCDFTERHVTNVMLYDKFADKIDINKQYTGRIINVNMINEILSFLLLNVTFTDSGNFTDDKDSCENAKSTIFVTRWRLTAQLDKSRTLDFMCTKATTPLIKFNTIGHADCKTLATYNNTHKKCTIVADEYVGRVENCRLTETTFYITITSIQWSDKITYLAWDDETGLLLDSIFMDIQENREETSTYFLESNYPYEISEWLPTFLIMMLVVCILVAAGIARITFRWLQRRRANRYGNESQIPQISSSVAGTSIMSTTKSYAFNPTDFLGIRCHDNVKREENQIRSRDAQSVCSSSEDINEFDQLNDYADLQRECCSDDPYLCSASETLRSTDPTIHTAAHGTMAKHSYMTLQQIALDPTVTMKS